MIAMYVNGTTNYQHRFNSMHVHASKMHFIGAIEVRK